MHPQTHTFVVQVIIKIRGLAAVFASITSSRAFGLAEISEQTAEQGVEGGGLNGTNSMDIPGIWRHLDINLLSRFKRLFGDKKPGDAG